MRTLRTLICLVPFLLVLFVFGELARAADLSGGTISSTVTLTENTELTGDITCAVPLATPGVNPCIAFGANNIKLALNGHTITGPANPPTGCSLPTDSMFGVGVFANGRSDVRIEGPGVIRNFERWGIFLVSSSGVTVRNVTVSSNCWSGMQTSALSDSTFEEDNWVNNAAGSNGAACGGICLANSNNNRSHKCTFYGNGSLDYAGGNVDFGIGFEGSSSGNVIERNDIAGNTSGIKFFNTSSNNLVRHNIIAGNPPGQVTKTFTAGNQLGADIVFRANFSGMNNMFEDNFCLTYIAGAGPTTPPCPSAITEGREDSTNRLSLPEKVPGSTMGAQLVVPDETPSPQSGAAMAFTLVLSLTLLVAIPNLLRKSRGLNRVATASSSPH